jgi:thiol-disulfide isomerase/thioredoxin
MMGCGIQAQNSQFSPLEPGDTLPDLKFMVSTGNNNEMTNIREFKGKLVLLDFWGISCVDCLASMPHMLSLQEQFGDRLKILVVTSNTDKEIAHLFAKYKKRSPVPSWLLAADCLPFVTSDSVFSALFPHRALPTHVWLDSSLKFIATTYSTSTTATTITGLLNGDSVQLDESRLRNLDFQNAISWLSDSSERVDALFYKFFSNRIEFGMGTFGFCQEVTDSNLSIVGLNCLNRSAVELYKVAYQRKFPDLPYIPDNRIFFDSIDREKFIIPRNHSEIFKWAEKNTYCYSLRTPMTRLGKVYETMVVDLDEFFNIKSDIQTKMMKCWVLKRYPKTPIRSISKKEKNEIEGNKLLIYHNKIIQVYNALGDILRINYPGSIFLDKTEYSGFVDVELPWAENKQLVSFKAVKNALRQYGLDLVQEQVSIPMLILKGR